MTNLQKRILAACIYFPFLLLCTWDTLSFSLLMSVCAGVAWYEFLNFFPEFRRKKFNWKQASWILAGVLPILFLAMEFPVAQAVLFVGLIWQIAVIWNLFHQRSLVEFLSSVQLMVFGFIYITGLFLVLCVLQRQPGGREAIWFLLLVVGASDSGAYFAGKYLGQKPFFNYVSPSKTREGFFGGLAAGIVVGVMVNLLFRYFDFSSMPIWKVVFVAALVSVFSSFGDLLESLIKRNFGVKDSGKIIAGHGGILDRFDGVIFAALPLLLYVVINKGFGG